MATVQRPKKKNTRNDVPRGLLANGSSGAWQADIDEALSGEQNWLQIEGPAVSLYFEIPSLEIVTKLAAFLAPHPTRAKRLANGSGRKAASLALGGSDSLPVSLIKDDEYDDRFYFVIGFSELPMARFTVVGKDVTELAEALQQALEDVEDEE